ncbi:MAG: Uma2 family endonuclease [Cyanobacteria bacterium P01_F01_bin.53]
MVLTVSPAQFTLSPGSEVTLKGQSWADYEALLDSRGDDAAIKVSFYAQTQEIFLMAPMAGHGRRIDTLSDLVKALLRHQGRDYDSAHPVTFKRLKEAGTEPDASFYIQNWPSISGKERIDLSQAPPPDLAIEVDLTSLTGRDIYRVLGVPELWIYRERSLSIYVLTEGIYKDSSMSPTFPDLDIQSILPEYVELAWSTCSSRALREFEVFLRSL